MNPVDFNITEIQRRILNLERQLREAIDTQNQISLNQDSAEQETKRKQFIHLNHIRNGDLLFDRNKYLYTTDFGGGTGENANVSEEAAFVYALPKDTSVETTGSISSGTNLLTINDPLFVAGDNGALIYIYGAGNSGSMLVANISGAPLSSTTCNITLNAATTVTNARVRFRIVSYVEDTTDVNPDANYNTNNALKTTNHTRYNTTANNPDYDKVNGQIRYSDSSNVIGFPLKINNIFPSRFYILSFHYKLENPVDGFTNIDPQFYGGVWDSSNEKNYWVEDKDPPNLSATYTGTSGTTSRTYLVRMWIADGRTINTIQATVNNTASSLNQNNYVTLSWYQNPSVIKSEVWTKVGSNFYRIGFPYPSNTFYDTGQIINSGTSFPSADITRFQAKVETNFTNFPEAQVGKWVRGQMNIIVPSNWDASNVQKLWIILGIKNSIVGSGSSRVLKIDLVSFDDKSGVFSTSPYDFQAARNVSSTPTSGDQGPIEFPDIPPGGGNCPFVEDLIETNLGQVPAWKLVGNGHKYKIRLLSGNYSDYKAEFINNEPCYKIFLDSGKVLTGSSKHRIILNEDDLVGKDLQSLQINDIILTNEGQEYIVNKLYISKKPVVKITLNSTEKIYWHNSVAVHNRKNEF